MNLFTSRVSELYEREIDGHKKYIELQKEIIAQKLEEIFQLKSENIQLKEQLRAAQESPPDKDLQPIFTRNEPWTIKRQRLEREDRQSPEVIAERMRLEAHWKKRNEEINAREERNA